jgi:hypothetical protein
MSFIDLPINDMDEIQEDKPVPEGEYLLVIADAKEKQAEDGSLKGILVICEISGQAGVGAANVLHNISLPLPGDEETKVANKLKFIKRFIQLFKIPSTGGKLNLQDFLGKAANCYLTQEEYNGNYSNKIKLPNSK